MYARDAESGFTPPASSCAMAFQKHGCLDLICGSRCSDASVTHIHVHVPYGLKNFKQYWFTYEGST